MPHILPILLNSYNNINGNKNISIKRTTKICLKAVMSKICLKKYFPTSCYPCVPPSNKAPTPESSKQEVSAKKINFFKVYVTL